MRATSRLVIYDARTSGVRFRPAGIHNLLPPMRSTGAAQDPGALLEGDEERQVSVDGTPRPLPVRSWSRHAEPVEFTRAPTRCRRHSWTGFHAQLTVAVPDPGPTGRMLSRARPGSTPGTSPRRAAAGAGRPISPWRATRCGRSTSRRRSAATSGHLPCGPATPRRCSRRGRRGAHRAAGTAAAWAWLSGRDYVDAGRLKALARPTFRHRIQLRPMAELGKSRNADGGAGGRAGVGAGAAGPGTAGCRWQLTGRGALAALRPAIAGAGVPPTPRALIAVKRRAGWGHRAVSCWRGFPAADGQSAPAHPGSCFGQAALGDPEVTNRAAGSCTGCSGTLAARRPRPGRPRRGDHTGRHGGDHTS